MEICRCGRDELQADHECDGYTSDSESQNYRYVYRRAREYYPGGPGPVGNMVALYRRSAD